MSQGRGEQEVSTLTVPGAEQGAQHLEFGIDDVAALGKQRRVRDSWDLLHRWVTGHQHSQ